MKSRQRRRRSHYLHIFDGVKVPVYDPVELNSLITSKSPSHYYKFTDSGTNLNDFGSGADDGTAQNGVLPSQTSILDDTTPNESWFLDHLDDQILLHDGPFKIATYDVYMEVYWRPDSTITDDQTIMSKVRFGTEWALKVTGSGSNLIFVNAEGTSGSVRNCTWSLSPALEDGTTYQIFVQKSGTTAEAYLNGVSLGSPSVDPWADIKDDAGTSAWIGRVGNTGAGGLLGGHLDIVVWSGGVEDPTGGANLTAAEIYDRAVAAGLAV